MPDPQFAVDRDHLVATYDQVADVYDTPARRYSPFCADRMVMQLKPRRGAKLLDVATGTGSTLTAAAQLVGRDGRVTGIDLAERMLDAAQHNIDKMAQANVDLHVMDAQALEFRSRYFDHVTCAYGLYLLPDMPAALKQWYRVLKPGGTVILSSFARGAFQPMAHLLREQLAEFGMHVAPPPWLRLTELEHCRALLHDAGFTDIETHTEQLGYHLKGATDWWELVWSGELRANIEQLDPEQQTQLHRDHCARVEALVTDKGLWLDVETIFASGRRPQDSG
ncbi:MAG: class I SAM-dependent methyltransferase [Pseudomonadota bacterium]|nr:MAG: class I SAM-dependent methyltransferase [Pseudomonadota bacterium]